MVESRWGDEASDGTGEDVKEPKGQEGLKGPEKYN